MFLFPSSIDPHTLARGGVCGASGTVLKSDHSSEVGSQQSIFHHGSVLTVSSRPDTPTTGSQCYEKSSG